MILVDSIRLVQPTKAYPYATSCHMASDRSVDELLTFAYLIDLKSWWLQDAERRPHFDMTANKRDWMFVYMASGYLRGFEVQEVSTRELLRRMHRPRKEDPGA